MAPEVKQIVNAISNPAYVLDTVQIRNHFKKYCDNTPDHNQVLFSVKSNHDSGLLNIASEYVHGFDVSNYAEFECIENTHNKIVSLCGPAFNQTDLQKIQEQHLDRLIVVFDSIDQYKSCLSSISEKTEIMFRINTAEIDDSFNSAFGVKFSEIVHHPQFVGLHMHMSRSSNMRNIPNYLQFIKKCSEVPGVKTVNIGGGQHYYDWFLLREQLEEHVEIIIEPGQPFFIDAIYAVGQILSVKNKRGYNNVITNLSIDCHLKWSRDKRLLNTGEQKCYVFGPTCQGTDIIGEFRADFCTGDKIVFENINPLTLEIATSFNGIQPAEKIYV